jgi:hypothetical protein
MNETYNHEENCNEQHKHSAVPDRSADQTPET